MPTQQDDEFRRDDQVAGLLQIFNDPEILTKNEVEIVNLCRRLSTVNRRELLLFLRYRCESESSVEPDGTVPSGN